MDTLDVLGAVLVWGWFVYALCSDIASRCRKADAPGTWREPKAKPAPKRDARNPFLGIRL